MTKFVDEIKANPDLLKYIAFPDIHTDEDFIKEVWEPLNAAQGECLFAIIDKATAAKDGDQHAYAGTVALTNTNQDHAVTELGVMVFPAFQRTHVATNAIGLLMQYCLDPPSAGGLGLRRVEWKCHSENIASRKTALRMRFEFEGIARWHRTFVLGISADALAKRNETKEEVPGRHTASFGIAWDEWDEKRPLIVALMEKY